MGNLRPDSGCTGGGEAGERPMGALAVVGGGRPPDAGPEPELVPLAEAARLLGGISVDLLYTIEKRGQLRMVRTKWIEKRGDRLVRIGPRTMVPVSEIERLAREGAPWPVKNGSL